MRHVLLLCLRHHCVVHRLMRDHCRPSIAILISLVGGHHLGRDILACFLYWLLDDVVDSLRLRVHLVSLVFIGVLE